MNVPTGALALPSVAGRAALVMADVGAVALSMGRSTRLVARRRTLITAEREQ